MHDWTDIPARRLFSVYGIPVRIDATFLFAALPVLLTVVFRHFVRPIDYITAAGLMLGGVFVSILMHELGHALAARVFRVGCEEIRVGGFYGFAVLSGRPAQRWQSVLILLAGPIANLVLFCFFWLLLGWPQDSGQLAIPAAARELPILDAPGVRVSIRWLASLNLALAVFNLLPAFPLDGGRIFRIAAGRFLDDRTSVRLVATLGILIGAWSCFGVAQYPALLFIGPLLVMANYAIRTGEIPAPVD